MSASRCFDTDFWADYYTQSLTQEEQMIFVYLFTCPESSVSGFFQTSTRQIAFFTKVEEPKVIATLQKFESDGKAIYDDGLIFVTNMSKHQHGEKLGFFHRHLQKMRKLVKPQNRASDAFLNKFDKRLQKALEEELGKGLEQPLVTVTVSKDNNKSNKSIPKETKKGITKRNRSLPTESELFELLGKYPRLKELPGFLDAWRDRIQSRREQSKPMTFLIANSNLKELVVHPDPIGLLAISNGNGYVGLIHDRWERENRRAPSNGHNPYAHIPSDPNIVI